MSSTAPALLISSRPPESRSKSVVRDRFAPSRRSEARRPATTSESSDFMSDVAFKIIAPGLRVYYHQPDSLFILQFISPEHIPRRVMIPRSVGSVRRPD